MPPLALLRAFDYLWRLMAKTTTFQKLTYAAYGFYALVALVWALLDGLMQNKLIAVGVLIIFLLQAKYQHRLSNLILGILLFAFSIFGALDFVAWGGKQGFDNFIYIMLSISVTSMFFSIILVFSYLKLSFGNDT